MIVIYLENGFEAVLQRHHARLAASLLEKLEWIKVDPYKIDLILQLPVTTMIIWNSGGMVC